MRVCLLHLTVYTAHSPSFGPSIPQKTDVRQDWEKLFAPNATPAALKQYAAEKREVGEESELALRCLELLDRIEEDFKSPFAARAVVRKREGIVEEEEQDASRRNPFPDELFVSLAAFVKVEHIERRSQLKHVQARLELS